MVLVITIRKRAKYSRKSHALALWMIVTTDVILHIMMCSICYNAYEFTFSSSVFLETIQNYESAISLACKVHL